MEFYNIDKDLISHCCEQLRGNPPPGCGKEKSNVQAVQRNYEKDMAKQQKDAAKKEKEAKKHAKKKAPKNGQTNQSEPKILAQKAKNKNGGGECKTSDKKKKKRQERPRFKES